MKITNTDKGLKLDGQFGLTFKHFSEETPYAYHDARDESVTHLTVTNFHWVMLKRKTKVGRFIEAAKYLWRFV